MRRLTIIVVVLAVSACSDVQSTPVAPTATRLELPSATATVAPARASTMTFGTGLDDTTLSVTGATRQFKTTAEKICWSAVLSAPVGATSVGAVVSLIGPGTTQTVVASDPKVPVTDPAAGLIAKCEDLRFLLGQQAGTYSIRYVHGGTVLAEGTFKLVK